MSELPAWLQQTLTILSVLLPYLLFAAICLWAINWKKMWPTLKEGAWVPLLLLLILVAMVWSRIRPSTHSIAGIITVGNFWWQLTAVGALAALGLFCGWLQERYSWTPFEVATEPATNGHQGHDDHHRGSVDDPHPRPVKEDPLRKHTAGHDRGSDRGGEG